MPEKAVNTSYAPIADFQMATEFVSQNQGPDTIKLTPMCWLIQHGRYKKTGQNPFYQLD
jgi:hypothetical protein